MTLETSGIFCSLVVIYFCLCLASTADYSLSPALSVIVRHLKIAPAVAGATFLAFGNGAPDVFASISAAKDPDTVRLAIGSLLGGAAFVVFVVVGVVVFSSTAANGGKPFVIKQTDMLSRDIFFLWIGIILLFLFGLRGHISLVESVVFFVLYSIYVFTVFFQERSRRLEAEINSIISEDGISLIFDDSDEEFGAKSDEDEISEDRFLIGAGDSHLTVNNLDNNTSNVSTQCSTTTTVGEETIRKSFSKKNKSDQDDPLMAFYLSSNGHDEEGYPEIFSEANNSSSTTWSLNNKSGQASRPSSKGDRPLTALSELEGGKRMHNKTVNGTKKGLTTNSSSSSPDRAKHITASSSSTRSLSPDRKRHEVTSNKDHVEQGGGDTRESSRRLNNDILLAKESNKISFLGWTNTQIKERITRRVERLNWSELDKFEKVRMILMSPILLARWLSVPDVESPEKSQTALLPLGMSLFLIFFFNVPVHGMFFWSLILIAGCLAGRAMNLWMTNLLNASTSSLSKGAASIIENGQQQIDEKDIEIYMAQAAKKPLIRRVPYIVEVGLGYLSFAMGILWISLLADWLVDWLSTLGDVTHLSPEILGVTLLSWGNSMGDLAANAAVAKRGLGEMAITGCFAAPTFNLLFGLGISMAVACLNGGQGGKLELAILESPVTVVYLTLLLIGLPLMYLMIRRSNFTLTRSYAVFWAFLYCLASLVALATVFLVKSSGTGNVKPGALVTKEDFTQALSIGSPSGSQSQGKIISPLAGILSDPGSGPF